MKLNKYSELRGEWWIAGGEALFADGDVGDKTHEAYVIEHVQSQYADDEFNRGDYIDWDGFEQKVLAEKLQELGVENVRNEGEILEQALMERGMTFDEISIARLYGDPRQYGVETLGWKRVKENYVETQKFVG